MKNLLVCMNDIDLLKLAHILIKGLKHSTHPIEIWSSNKDTVLYCSSYVERSGSLNQAEVTVPTPYADSDFWIMAVARWEAH